MRSRKNHRLIAAVLCAVLLLSSLPKGMAAEGKLPFEDLRAEWYLEAVEYCYTHNLINGVTGTSFAPDDPLTRAQMVTILYRAAGLPPVEDDVPFPDATER